MITAIEWNVYTNTSGPAVCGELVTAGYVSANDDSVRFYPTPIIDLTPLVGTVRFVSHSLPTTDVVDQNSDSVADNDDLCIDREEEGPFAGAA